MKPSKLSYGLLLASLFSASAGTSVAATSYRITSLGGVRPTAINDLGYVVGVFAGNAVQIDPGGLMNPIMWPLTTPTAINASGQVSGVYMGTPQQPMSAQSWSLGFQNIGNLGGTWGQAYGINNAGWVVGRSQTASGDMHAFLFQNSGPLVDLGTLTVGAGYDSFARGINSSGQVVGYSERSGNVTKAFVYENGSMQEASIGSGNQYGFDINDNGKLVGQYADPGNNIYQAFVYDWNSPAKTLTYLPSAFNQSQPRAINNSDQVVGLDWTWVNGVWTQYAALWQDNQLYKLDDLIEDGAGWVLTDAYDINASGQIIGVGLYDGTQQGYLVTPVSEAGTWAMLLAGLGLIGLRLGQSPWAWSRRIA